MGTSDFTKRIMKGTKVFGQLSSNNTFFADIWFSTLKAEYKAMAEGVDYYGNVKKNHKGFFLDTLEKSMKE